MASVKNKVYEMLRNNREYLSGEDMAKELDVTRSGVWKAIKELRKDGYVIEAVTNRGYKLSESDDALDAELVRSQMQNKINTIFYPSIDSTNSQAKRLIEDGHTEEMLIVAAQQTAGRGRQGKSFFSPEGTGIYFTIVFHPMTSLSDTTFATTATSVAVCKAIEELTDKRPKIKWVNDVYLEGQKICGILTEAVTDVESGIVTSLIIGIGVNIHTTQFPDDIVSASCLNADVKRADLIAKISDNVYEIFNGNGIDCMDYYRSHSLIIGRQIKYIQNGETKFATAAAIDENGGLVIIKDDGVRETLTSGEITIRPAQ